ncbi:hypothetical protein GCM10023151_09160 [Kangiella marina]|uniref:Yip1 domain-containing protein n=1 Tax=Kangiella marina TaxID=1079178 RepID=A0ABP8IHX5_9GAMM
MGNKDRVTLNIVRFILINLPYAIFIMMCVHLDSSYVERHIPWGAVVIVLLYGSAFLLAALIYWGVLWCFYIYKGDAVLESCRTNLVVNTVIYCLVAFFSLPLLQDALYYF